MTTNRMKVRLCIDQDAVVARRDVAIGSLKLRRAADRVAVMVAHFGIMTIRFVPCPAPLEQPGEPERTLGEAGLPRRSAFYRAIACSGSDVSIRSAARKSRWKAARSWREVRAGRSER